MTEACAIPPSTHFDPSAPVPEEYDVFCEGCGYSLVGLTGDKCPECGKPFEPAALPYARVPWLHRRRIGFNRAYWRTVWNVVRAPESFAAELCRPVRISAKDARRFRATTAALASLSLAASVSVITYLTPGNWSWQDTVAFSLALPLGIVVAVIFLRLATDMPVFIWKGLPSLPPHELAPLHQYASAPLALAPLVLLLTVGVPELTAYANAPPWGFRVALSAAGVVIVHWLYLCWRTPLALMRAATGCGRRQVRKLALYLPAHVLLMLLLSSLLFATGMVPIIWLIDYLSCHG